MDIYQLLIIPAVTGLVQAAKNAGLKSQYAPFLAVLLGVGGALMFDVSGTGVLMGVLSGLASIGLYQFPKGSKNSV